MNTIDFHKSTTNELLAIKDRVRNLINHWGEDGRYKEAVLKSVIQNFLPEKYKIATGFIVKQTPIRGEHESSNQIDLIIYNTSYPVLFKENDFVILTSDAVVGIIEVKANVIGQNLKTVIEKCNKNGEFILKGRVNNDRALFNGIFSYESNNVRPNTIKDNINRAFSLINLNVGYSDFCVNHMSIDQNYFYKFWKEEILLNQPHYLYKIDNLSFSFFISNLIDWISDNSVIENSNLWFPTDKNLLTIEKF